MVGVSAQKDGWTTYGPSDDELAAGYIKGALDAAVHDCRLFARLAREARFADLPARLHLSWEQFCDQRLRQPVDVVEAMIAGVEVLGEQVPVPLELAERVGRKLMAHGGDRKSEQAKNQGYNITLKRGTGSAYYRARLQRDHPQLEARVRAGELTPYAAAIAAGIVKPKTPLQQLQYWWRKASEAERTAFRESTAAGEQPAKV